MKKTKCPITKKVFDCRQCLVITDEEKCPYMLRDEQTECELKFLRKIVEEEFKSIKELRAK